MLWNGNINLFCQVLSKFPHITGYRALRLPANIDGKKLLKSQLALSATDGESTLLYSRQNLNLNSTLESLIHLSSTDGNCGIVMNRKRTGYRCYWNPSRWCFGWFVCLWRSSWCECHQRWCKIWHLGSYSTGNIQNRPLHNLGIFKTSWSTCCMDISEVVGTNLVFGSPSSIHVFEKGIDPMFNLISWLLDKRSLTR